MTLITRAGLEDMCTCIRCNRKMEIVKCTIMSLDEVELLAIGKDPVAILCPHCAFGGHVNEIHYSKSLRSAIEMCAKDVLDSFDEHVSYLLNQDRELPF